MLKAAIIGLGKMGMSHAAILGGLPNVEMAAMCDTDSLLQSAFKKLTKAEDLSEDEVKDLEDELQKLTDKYIKEIDSMVDAKSKEIMTV